MGSFPGLNSGARSNDRCHVLIVDDEANIVRVLQTTLGDQYDCTTATSADEALDILRERTFDLVLCDIMMPGKSGLEVLPEIAARHPLAMVIMISGSLEITSAIEAMRLGAFDYVTKPFVKAAVQAAVDRALRHLAVVKANRAYESHLEEMVRLQTGDLRLSNEKLNQTLDKLYLNYRATLRALAAALEARDMETRGHSDRVVAYCLEIGTAAGVVGEDLVTLEHGALLHDIGKIGVPDHILLKQGALTEEEWGKMRSHVEYGAHIIRDIEFLRGASMIVAQHHERYDGSGYPNKIEGDNICLGARIFAVADAVDAITSDRPYRKGKPFEAAADELVKCSGQHFDPSVVEIFTSIPFDRWRAIRELAKEPALSVRSEITGATLSYPALVLGGK